MAQNTNSYTKRTKLAKDNAAIASLAMQIAKDDNDPWQKKAAMFKAKFFEFKKKIAVKYGPRARSLYFKNKATENNK